MPSTRRTDALIVQRIGLNEEAVSVAFESVSAVRLPGFRQDKGGRMRSQALVTAVLLVAALVPTAVATTGDRGAPPQQRAIVNFEHPTKVSTAILRGRYLVVHDEGKMARGEPCTALYRFETPGGSQEAPVSFTCMPRTRPAVERFTIATVWDAALGVDTLTEYQFAGDAEGHGVPIALRASDERPEPESVVCVR